MVELIGLLQLGDWLDFGQRVASSCIVHCLCYYIHIVTIIPFFPFSFSLLVNSFNLSWWFYFIFSWFSPLFHWEGGSEWTTVWCWAAAGSNHITHFVLSAHCYPHQPFKQALSLWQFFFAFLNILYLEFEHWGRWKPQHISIIPFCSLTSPIKKNLKYYSFTSITVSTLLSGSLLMCNSCTSSFFFWVTGIR